MTKIYIDADGCPVKDEVYRVAERYKLPVVLVANKRLNLPVNSLLEMVVVTGAFDAADDWIVKNSKPNDIVVTADILLADRCVKKSVRVLGPKGVELAADNIGSAVPTQCGKDPLYSSVSIRSRCSRRSRLPSSWELP